MNWGRRTSPAQSFGRKNLSLVASGNQKIKYSLNKNMSNQFWQPNLKIWYSSRWTSETHGRELRSANVASRDSGKKKKPSLIASGNRLSRFFNNETFLINFDCQILKICYSSRWTSENTRSWIEVGERSQSILLEEKTFRQSHSIFKNPKFLTRKHF